jgi:hypothetical protein
MGVAESRGRRKEMHEEEIIHPMQEIQSVLTSQPRRYAKRLNMASARRASARPSDYGPGGG